MRRFHLFIITLILLFSCTQLTPEEKMIKDTMAKQLRYVMDKSLLIDAGDKIKLIGPPFASQRMAELFYTICTQ